MHLLSKHEVTHEYIVYKNISPYCEKKNMENRWEERFDSMLSRYHLDTNSTEYLPIFLT